MTNQIHGHDVIAMMTAATEPYSRESLKAAIIGKFGADARFHTCSAENMNADAMIDFLAARGKFLENIGGIAINPEKVCQH